MEVREDVVNDNRAKFLGFSLGEGSPNLPAEIFALKKRLSYESLVHLALRFELASNRLATHKVKHRGEVSGTGKKPWQQKKTGRARAGSRRSPIFTGGGIVFGPTTERNYKIGINKRQYQIAFCYLLSRMLEEGRLLSFDLNLVDFRCKGLIKRLEGLDLPKTKILIVSDNQLVKLASANVSWLACVSPSRLGLLDLYRSRIVIFESEALERIKARFSASKSNARILKKRKLLANLSTVEGSQSLPKPAAKEVS